MFVAQVCVASYKERYLKATNKLIHRFLSRDSLGLSLTYRVHCFVRLLSSIIRLLIWHQCRADICEPFPDSLAPSTAVYCGGICMNLASLLSHTGINGESARELLAAVAAAILAYSSGRACF